MDIYGYQAYQYNQPDELVKQNLMLTQQALAAPLPFDREVPEAHAMPEPSGAPWNVQEVSWGITTPPQLMQFTGQPPMNPFMPIPCKRKSLDVEPVIPAKQHITEDKMAAHLNGLHISSQYTPYSLANQDVMDVGIDSSSDKMKIKRPVIVLSEELKKLKDEPLLPPTLLQRFEKPCMSLMVWKPKDSATDKKLSEIEESEEPKEESRRVGVLVAEKAEFSGMDVEM